MIERALVFALVVGCSSSPPATTCIQAGARVRTLAHSASLGDVATELCRDRAWSESARACVAGLGALDRAASCYAEIGASADVLATAIAAEILRQAAKADVPSPNPATATGTGALVVEVRETGIVVWGAAVPEAELDRIFRVAVVRDRETQVVVKVAKSVAHGRVIAVLERAKAAGLTRLAISTAP